MQFDKYLSLFYEAKENGAEIDQSVKDYIDGRIEELDAEGNVSGARYNVIPSFEKGRLLVIDIDAGSVIGNIDPKGKLISVPVVYGDSVSFAVQDDQGSVNGTVRSLPDGNVIDQFRVAQPKTGKKYKEVMGMDDDKGLQIEPELDDDTDDDDSVDDIKINELEDEAHELRQELEDAERELTDLQSMGDQTSAIRAQIDTATKHAEEAREELDAKQEQIADLTSDLTKRMKKGDAESMSVTAARPDVASSDWRTTKPPAFKDMSDKKTQPYFDAFKASKTKGEPPL